MTHPNKSFVGFGVYLSIMGFLLVVIPRVPLQLLGVAAPKDHWVRVAGMLVLFLAYYYIQVARGKVNDLYLWTVYARATVIVFFTAFVLADLAPPMLILFGVLDFAFAAWTWLALREAGTAPAAVTPNATGAVRYEAGAERHEPV